MKKIISIGYVGLLVCTLGFTSCVDEHDTPVNVFGNNSIKAERTISIANLKEKYNDFIDTTSDTYTEIEGETRIEGVIIGDDESGNFYHQLAVADETGAIMLDINTTGLYAFCPVGQKVVVDCEGLVIGSRYRLAAIGSPYNGKVGNMPEAPWKQHVRLINKPSLFYDELTPREISSAADLDAIEKKDAPVLVTFKNVKFPDADGTKAYAPEEELPSNSSITFIERDMQYSDGTKCAAVVHTSVFSTFATEKLPEGEVNVTGVLTRYNTTWQLIIRTLDDIKRNK